MKIFEKDGWIFIQMMDMTSMEMLIDFSIEKESFNELRDHMIEHLIMYQLEKEGSNKAIETYLKMLEIRLSQRMRL